VTFEVLAPVTGRVAAMEDVADPVFSQGLVGPGIALVPDEDGPQDAVAPIAGRILKLHPHAFVIVSESGPGVLVHLGLDTVGLDGEGFTLLHAENDTVDAGEPVITWDPAAVRAHCLDTVVPVVVMNLDNPRITVRTAVGERAARGRALLDVS